MKEFKVIIQTEIKSMLTSQIVTEMRSKKICMHDHRLCELCWVRLSSSK